MSGEMVVVANFHSLLEIGFAMNLAGGSIILYKGAGVLSELVLNIVKGMKKPHDIESEAFEHGYEMSKRIATHIARKISMKLKTIIRHYINFVIMFSLMWCVVIAVGMFRSSVDPDLSIPLTRMHIVVLYICFFPAWAALFISATTFLVQLYTLFVTWRVIKQWSIRVTARYERVNKPVEPVT